MKKTISILAAFAVILSMTACAKETESEPAVTTTAPIYVQEDNYQTSAATEATEPTVESEESKPEVKPAPDTKDNEFNLDGIYNTTIENNIDDDVYFEVYIEYTKDDGEVVSETITLNDNTSYDDLANKLSAFGLVTTDATREISYSVGERYDYAFEYKGIGHNISLAPDTETALYLELVDDKGIATDASLLGNSSYNPSVKAISSKLLTDSWIEDEDGNLKHHIPVKVIFKIYVSDDMILEYADFKKERLNEDGALEFKVGMSSCYFTEMFKKEVNVGRCYIIKNTDYTLVVYDDDTFGSYIGDIILIKN